MVRSHSRLFGFREATKSNRRPHFVPRLLVLEDRTVPSTTFNVTILGDSGAGSLRQAILNANATPGDDTIRFEVTGTIYLAGALPDLNTNINIQGPGADLLTVRRDTGGSYRIFTVVSGATVALRDLSITHGFAQHGGGIFNAGTLTVQNSSLSRNVSGNEEPWSGSDGGGIYNTGTLTVTNSTLSNNDGATGGGGIYNSAGGTVMVTASTLSGNTTAIIGGAGIYNADTLTVTNSTLSGNEVWWYGSGGGIYNLGTLTVTASTLVDNYAGDGGVQPGGGGIYNAGTLHIRNTILAGNTADTAGPDLKGSLTSSGYNLIGDTSGGSGFAPTDLLDVDPLLGPLQDNGGPTWTVALLPGSPAIDAGDNTDAPQFDQRGEGYPRIFGGRIDIGAYEVQTALPGNTPPVAVNDSYSTNEDTTLTVLAPGVLDNDSDADGNRLTAVLVSGPAHGTLTLYYNGSFTYTPAANYNGPDSFTYKANDGAANSNLATVSITVIAVNDAPVNRVPGAQTMAKNTNLIFSSRNGNAISIADVDAGSALIQVTLAVTNGTLTLSGTTGLSFSTGDGYADRTMTFTGTIQAINAALDGLRFTPRKNFTGAMTLTITTNDLGNSGTGGALSDTDMVTIVVQ